MSEELDRALGFERAVLEGCSTRVEPFRWGAAFFQEDYPLSYTHNVVWADRVGTLRNAARLAEEVNRLQGGAGLEHREVVVTGGSGEPLAPGFERLGWTVGRDVFMALHRDPDRPPGTPAAEVSWTEFRPALEAQVRGRPYATSEEVVRQLVDRRNAVAQATHLRHFAARAGAEIAAHCDLYSDGRTAQIEDVFTFEEYRGRGLARAVVLAAASVALEEGHDFVFLCADDVDWPKELYRRLGFDAIGRSLSFMRYPEGYPTEDN